MKFLVRFRFPEEVGARDHLAGALLGLVYYTWLLATAGSIGFVRDEGVYFRAASSYASFWRAVFEHGTEAMQRGAIDAHFTENHEHPALMKTLFGLSEWLFHERWHIFAEQSTAFRAPAMAMAGLALWITYVFGARAYCRAAGLVAAVLLALMPHVFFHAHLACFDVPIMTMWLLCVYLHWRAQATGSFGYAVATGIAFGLALETKHNAWILPAALVPHAFFVHRHAIWKGLSKGRFVLPSSVVCMAVLGPIVFYALWPYIWNDTLSRVQWWFEFHLNHEYYNMEFLGRNYYSAPSPTAYLPVLVLATVPTITLVLFGTGAAERLVLGVRRLSSACGLSPKPAEGVPSQTALGEADLLLALAFVVSVGPFFLPKTPIFGGTKHWLTAYPMLALFAGRGYVLARRGLRRSMAALQVRARRAAEFGLFASVVAAPLAITVHSNPYGIAAYVPFVGGTAGGADLGLNRQFWGYTAQNAASEYLNENAPRGATVYIHDTTWDAWARMEDEGRVRRDLRAVGAPHESQLALVEHELHMNELDYAIWMAFGTDAPAYIVCHDGVPMVSVYRRR